MPIDYGKGDHDIQVFSIPGALTVGARAVPLLIPMDMRIVDARLACGTAPTGAAILVDVNKNGTTIFTTQGNRPTIAISGTSGSAAVPDVTTISAGDKLTVDIDQIGSTVAGSDLGIVVRLQQRGG